MLRQRILHDKSRKRRLMLPVLLLILSLVSAGIVIAALLIGQQEESRVEYVGAGEIAGFMQFTHSDAEALRKITDHERTRALTYGELTDLLELFHLREDVIYEEKRSGCKVERTTWNRVFEQILGLLDTSGTVTKEKLLLLAAPDGRTVETQMGIYQYDGTLTEQYRAYEAYVMEDKLLGIIGEYSQELTIKNVYVTDTKEKISFLYRGGVYRIPIETGESFADAVCNISMRDGVLTKVQRKQDTVEGTLLAMEETAIEIEGYGRMERNKELPVYQAYGRRAEKGISDIVIENRQISCIVEEKRICAILLLKPPKIQTVRVLLLNEDHGVHRESVYVTADGDTDLSGGVVGETLKAGAVCSAADYLVSRADGCLKIEGNDNARLYLCDENGNRISLPYAGSFEIRKYDEGFVVVNVLALEDYLCGVVPSEMPSSYPAEALKAQAICARSYAVMQLLGFSYAKYGAHMDDSVSYQVYNRQGQTESTTKAVFDTSGKVITAGGKIREAYYYSTSFGHSGSIESWNLKNSSDTGYLRSTWLREDEPEIDLSDEAAFSEYIQKPDAACYDSFARFFRWSAKLDLTGKSAAVCQAVNARKSANPQNIRIYPGSKEEGEGISNVSALGAVKTISTRGRNSCGGVKKLIVGFERGRVEILDEYSMRTVLGCAAVQVTFQDGSVSEGSCVLPSSYFAMNSIEHGSYLLQGGGYGHGLGMSQNGAKGMAEQNRTYEEILQKFYSGIELKDIGEVEGEAV